MYIRFTLPPASGSTENRYNLIDIAGWRITLEGHCIQMFQPGSMSNNNPLVIKFCDRHTARTTFAAICDAAERGDTIYKIPLGAILDHTNTENRRERSCQEN